MGATIRNRSIHPIYTRRESLNQLPVIAALEILGFEQVDEDFYKVFRDVELGEFDAEALRFWPLQAMRWMDG